MTGQERDYEAILSRVLHTTTDQLEPVGDGLTKIRTRLSEPWLKRQWWLLRSELMVLCWFLVVRCESLYGRIRSRSDLTDLAPDTAAGQEGQEADGGLRSLLSISTLAAGKRQQPAAGRAMAWLRPALAVAGAVVLVVAGVFALGSIRTVVGLANDTGTNSSNTGPGTGPGNPQGGGTALSSSGTRNQSRSGAAKAGTSTAPSKTGASATPCSAASPTAASSPPSSPPPSSPPPSSPPPSSPPPSSPPPSSPPPSSPPPSQGPLTGPVPGPTHEAIGTTALVMCEQTPAAQSSPSSQATAP